MKALTAIAILQRLVDAHGNLEVGFVDCEFHGYMELESISIKQGRECYSGSLEPLLEPDDDFIALDCL